MASGHGVPQLGGDMVAHDSINSTAERMYVDYRHVSTCTGGR